MKNCTHCNAPLNDDALFCSNCGTTTHQNQAQPNFNQAPNGGFNQNPQYAAPIPMVSPTDHTAEFSAQEVSDNKLFAVLVYLSSILGIAIALIANISNRSNYLKFHIKQALKLLISESIISFLSIVLFWTFIVPIAGGIALIIIAIVNIICFVQTLRGKSVEPPIISGISFLK